MGSKSWALSRSIFLILLILLFTNYLFAQAASGTLRGQVSDPSGAVVQSATVTAKSESGQATTAKTGKLGTYEIKGLAPGKYTVSAAAKGFAVSANDVEVVAGKEQKLDVHLEIAVEQQQVAVEETQTKVDIGSENNASAVVIKGKDLEALSDDPDELASELQALAGPAAGPNGGQMYIDGFSGGTLPPKSSIREIRVNQNPFSAQYDHLGYGRIEIFTKPGTEQFHGQLMFRANDAVFNARNPFVGTQKAPYQAQQIEGNIGGPINKKGSFFLNVERRNNRDSNVINATILDPSFNSVSLSQAFANPRTSIEISPRFDYQITASNTLTSRFEFNQDKVKNDGVGGLALPHQAYNSHSSERNLQVSDTQILNPRMVNETRFQYVRSTNSQNALSFLPQISVPGAFADGGNPIGFSSTRQDHYELQNYTSMALGNHFVRFGGRLRTTAETDNLGQNFNGTFSFSSLDSYQRTQRVLAQNLTLAQFRAANPNGPEIGPNQFSISAGQRITSNTIVDAGLYAEEDWKIRPDVMLSYGLRYETQNDIHDHADFAPRIGVAWAPGGTKNASPKTVLRAGFGLFYDRFGQNLVLQAQRLNGIVQEQFVLGIPPSSPGALDFYPNIPSTNTLNQQFIAIRQIDSKLRSPYVMQSALALERQLTKIANVSVTYLHSRGVHQLLSRNVNAINPSTGNQLFPGAGKIYQYQSEGIFEQNQVITNFNVRGKKLSIFGFYMLNYANGNTSGASSFPVNQYNLAADYGRLSYDIRHRLFLAGSLNMPYGFRLNPFMVVNSGQPFNITAGRDLNGDSIVNDRPTFATNPAQLQDVVTSRWGSFDKNPQAGEKTIPINFGTGPARVTLNVRLSKTFGLGGPASSAQSGGPRGGGGGGGRPGGGEGRGGGEGMGRGGFGGGGGGNSEQRYNLTFAIGATNLFNHANLGQPIGTITSSRFGLSNGLAGRPFSSNTSSNRGIDLQMNFSF